jgi:hypothetical protein
VAEGEEEQPLVVACRSYRDDLVVCIVVTITGEKYSPYMKMGRATACACVAGFPWW